MTEKQTNPFDDANFASGGGIWDGKTVTITSVKAVVSKMQMKDGTAVIDDKTGEQAFRNNLKITGLADDEDTERWQEYSAGSLVPTSDGDGFVKADGTPGQFHKNSAAARFFSAIKAGGFDLNRLFVGGKPTLQGLVGARFTFQAVPRLDKDKQPKKNKKGYVENDYYPVKFVGFAAGKEVPVPGNGAAAKDEAVALVMNLLASNNGTLNRPDMLRAVAASVIGKPNGNAILTTITKDEFHQGAPWKYNGGVLTL